MHWNIHTREEEQHQRLLKDRIMNPRITISTLEDDSNNNDIFMVSEDNYNQLTIIGEYDEYDDSYDEMMMMTEEEEEDNYSSQDEDEMYDYDGDAGVFGTTIDPPPLPDQIVVVRSNCNDNKNEQYLSILMSVQGMTCHLCTKVIEMVLIGLPHQSYLSRSDYGPIRGILDAVVDYQSSTVLVKLDNNMIMGKNGSSSTSDIIHSVAKTAVQKLADVGYKAIIKGENDTMDGHDHTSSISCYIQEHKQNNIIINNNYDVALFDWSISCTCIDNSINAKRNCPRHTLIKEKHCNIIKHFDNMI